MGSLGRQEGNLALEAACSLAVVADSQAQVVGSRAWAADSQAWAVGSLDSQHTQVEALLVAEASAAA